MKKLNYLLIVGAATLGLAVHSCSDSYLEQPALGSLSDEVLASKEGVNSLLIGAYGALDGSGNGNPWEVAPSNWIYGDIAGGDAHKGSDGGDQPAINSIATFRTDASNGFLNNKWRADYEGVSRANSVLAVLATMPEGELTEAEATNIEGQAKFLRAHFYFDLKKMFNMVPWIDETTTIYQQPNDQDVWPMIEADFKFAYDNLPATQSEVGRANKWAAAAYLAKSYLYQKKYAEAKAVFDQVITEGQTSNGLAYGLLDNYYEVFYAQWENHKESVFAIQMVSHDGTNGISNANDGNMLNFPYNATFRCCGFFQPSQDLVNSFKTNPATGLPYLENYNANPVKNDMGVNSSDPFTPYTGTLDPRLDWTVGRRELPYLDWGLHGGQNWVRLQSYGGPYSPKKYVYWQETQEANADQSSWAPGTANNVLIIRFADVLLMAAEAEIELDNLEKAREYINQVRGRAANEDGWVHTYVDNGNPLEGFTNTPAANYKINLYPAFADKEEARKAVRFERRLELGMEGHRFFDLVRWGIAKIVLDAYFDYEGSVTSDVTGASFTNDKNEYYPIPQAQIDISRVDGETTLTQNPGYQ
ncbi:putative outer membrane starch-binding protein [Anseongella ginsenosidimutans]|uniref:Putative outer membrane starch-binding protein n=1 Tax=Anseongella ginsenosidimutans TaxID=496056 RepID=A0A4R3KLE3_9SPHI|nr:RagB/SusD family nutrient uptake outer membrane protein [Anseongella ginsenosidimutans]QEC53767.1 RagB/SusD family nutrient uptake outer membrane protein [Anseongella ginsenosidimutans]TCS84909.1 putative outer membrane starch-binding protein [Anseongella ginsenosidimutans]